MLGRNDGWLKALKVGDEVAVGGGWDSPPRPVKIAAITPSGRFRLENGSEYNPDGRRRGGNSYDYFQQWTPEMAEALRKFVLANKMRGMDRSYAGSRTWKDLTLDQLGRIAAIIDETATPPESGEAPDA